VDGINVFTTAQEFRDMLDRQAAAAHRGLHEHQADITYGSHWVRFVDLDLGIIQFGRVLTLTDAASLTPMVWTRKAAVQASVDTLSVKHDMVLSARSDRLSPDSELGYTHRSHLWPVEGRLFWIAAAVDFDHRRFDEVGRFLLDVAFRQMRAHVIGR